MKILFLIFLVFYKIFGHCSLFIHQNRIIRWFSGNFDNIKQASEDILGNKPLLSLEGHYHVTASFQRYNSMNSSCNEILACFKYAYDSSKVFRYRLYRFYYEKNELKMKLFKLCKKPEEIMRNYSFNTSLYYPDREIDFEELVGCDVVWKPYGIISKILSKCQGIFPESILDEYLCYQGKLVNEPCEIFSSINPNVKLIVKDDLRLWKDRLWVNDQVFLTNGTQVIGNSLGIHYKFDKV